MMVPASVFQGFCYGDGINTNVVEDYNALKPKLRVRDHPRCDSVSTLDGYFVPFVTHLF
jgi:hypothetical protein